MIRAVSQAGLQPGVRAPADDDTEAIVDGGLRDRHEEGFFGRRRELWDIERWFERATRRISITGFGGQGNTELALEAGRWLADTGMFQPAVLVDYAQVQSEDAVQVAVSSIGSVLERGLAGTDKAAGALRETPTLVILDNLEALAPEPLRELLDAAVGWSTAAATVRTSS